MDEARRFDPGIGPRLGLAQFGRMLQFRGRGTRSEIISYALVAIPVGFLLHTMVVAVRPEGLEDFDLATLPILLAIWLPWPSLMVRRLHDEGLRGWCLLALVGAWIFSTWLQDDDLGQPHSALGKVALLIGFAASTAHVVMAFAPGTRGPNRFGPDPRV